jgi:hypothetical protein
MAKEKVTANNFKMVYFSLCVTDTTKAKWCGTGLASGLKVKTNSIAKARLFSIVTAKKRYNHLLSKILTSLFDIIAAIFLFFISNH